MKFKIFADESIVTEMRQLSSIEKFSIAKDKLQLPRDGNSTKGMFIFFLNTSIESIASILTNNHTKIMNPSSSYKGYYYDYLPVRGSINSRRIKNPGKTKITLKKERLKDYGDFQKAAPLIKTPIRISALSGKNFVYDLQPIIRLMKYQPKLKKIPLIERLRMFFTSIGYFYKNTNFDDYKKGPIFINLDDCLSTVNLNEFLFYQYLVILLKKSANVIYKVMMDIPEFEVLFYTSKGYILMNSETDFIRENCTKFINMVKRIKPEFTSAEEKTCDDIIESDLDSAVESKLKEREKLNIDSVANTSFDRVSHVAGMTAMRRMSGDDETISVTDEDISPNAMLPEEIASSIISQKRPEKIKDIEADKEEERLAKKKKSSEDDITKFAGEDEESTEEDKESSDIEDEAIDDAIEELESDDVLKSNYISSVINKRAGTKSAASLKRDKLLRERQMEIKIKDHTIGELIADIPKPPEIPTIIIPTTVTDNESMKKVRFANFEKTYMDELFDKDMARAITAFNDKGINVNVIKVEVNDTSTELVYQDTYTITFEDENRRRHTVTVNIPKLIDNKFLFINGKKKLIQKQLAGLPIIKTDRDEIQIITNYNKIFMNRVGSRFNPNMERLKKLLLDKDKQPKGCHIIVYKGDNSVINRPYATCLEYDELASLYNKVIINDCTFVFSVDMLKEELGSKYKEPTLDEIIIGYKGKSKEPIVYHTHNPDSQDMVSLMVMTSLPDYYEEFKQLSSGRKYVHNVIKMMEKRFPLIFALCCFEGISTVVQKFNNLVGSQRVTFVDKKEKGDTLHMYIQFKDAYIKYALNDLEACLLFNGFTDLEMKEYTIAELDQRETYLMVFDQLIGSSYYYGGALNYYDFMIDYKTKDILRLLGYPEDLVSLMIFASNMLADSSYSVDIDPKLYRLRSVEIIPAMLYKELTVAYSRYRKTANNANPTKISIDPDCVIKQLAQLPTVESYSTLSPIVEVKDSGITTMAGYRGMNSERAYTEDKRNYHDDMVGIIGLSTDIAGNCGKERHLVAEPNVMNAYGMFDLVGRENAKNLDLTKVLTGEELTYPMGVNHDDPARTAMTSKQSCHAIPVADQSPLLITNGYDSTIQYRTCSDFSVAAEQDGSVIDKNDKLGIMIVKYKDGTIKAIDLDKKIVQNGGGGFYLDNQLQTSLKRGDKFKEGDILAYDGHYFKDTPLGNKLTYGTKVKVAVISNMATYEDSMWSTFRLSRAMSTDITMKEVSIVIGKNSDVDYIAKVGDHVRNGEDLIRFDTSYSDAEMGELMHSIRQDLQEDVVNLGKSKFTSKHDGIVADIRVYPAVELSELSPSLRKMVNDVQKHDRDRRAFMDKYDKNKNSVYRSGILFKDTVGMVKPDQYGKIAGIDVQDGVLVEIFVTYHDEVSDGDKFAHMSANKATNGYMIPRGFEPYVASRPYEEIDVPVAPSALLQRGTPSVITHMLGYKVLIELKRKCFEILTGIDWNEKQREDRPYMDVHGNNVKPVSLKESTEVTYNEADIEYAKRNLAILESTFEMNKDSSGRYEANREYKKGEIVLAGLDFTKDVNRMVFETGLIPWQEGYTPNVKYDEDVNAYVAKDFIYFGEPLVI